MMFEAQKSQIKTRLEENYFPMIRKLDRRGWTEEDHYRNRLSRSLAAFAVEKLADLAPAQAANAIVDCGDDNGIDAIYFDQTKNRLWLVQSKAGGAPDMGDNKKFCDGIRDLVIGRFERFGAGFTRIQSDVENALETEGLQIIGCNIHLGDALGQHAVSDLNLLKTELNQFSARFDWQDLTPQVVYEWLTTEHSVIVSPVTLILENWYGVDTPRRAFYGLVSAAQLALLYQQRGKTLFERNIRHYLGDRSVNSGISATVQDRPEELFFLNNGLTAVCSHINHLPGASPKRGKFTLRGFSIVNGAQTVGSIAHVDSTAGPVSTNAKLLITLIEVGDAADNIGSQITRTRNTQNAVRGLHFAALDPQQERLRQELAVSGIAYYYRPSEEVALGGAGAITLENAATALACFSGTTRTIVALKKESGQIYDFNGEYYPTLFRSNLSGIHLGRLVRVYRYLNNILERSEYAETQFSRRMFYRHSRYFILHILARRHRALLDRPDLRITQADKIELSRIVTDLAETIYTVAEARFQRQKGYLSIFRNNTDAEPLARAVMQELAKAAAAQTPAASPPATT